MQNHYPSDDRRDSFVSEDLNDMEHTSEIHEKEEKVDQLEKIGPLAQPSASDPTLNRAEKPNLTEALTVSPKSASRTTFSTEDSSDEVLPEVQSSESPSRILHLTPDQQFQSVDHEAAHDPRQHGSADGSASSSVLATPHQELSDRFGSLDAGGIKRDSADDNDMMNGLGLKKDHGDAFAVKQAPARPAVVDVDGVDPLDTATVNKSPEVVTQRQEESKDATVQPDATTTSPIKSKLSLLPSALGFAAGLLPIVRSPPTATAATPSPDKAGSMSDSDDKSVAVTYKRHPNNRQTSTFSDTSSIHSTTSSNARGSADAAQETSAPGPSSWRSLTSFLSRASVAPIHESPATPTPGKAQRTAIEQARFAEQETPYTSFLLHHITSPSATADRRRSVELGGSQKLREGFERVKAEMVSAAKELRERDEQKRKRDSGTVPAELDGDIDEGTSEEGVVHTKDLSDSNPLLGPDGVDWQFWGAVMSDYEEVAKTRPKQLSRAIQQGIPAVVRGTIWQLMSSSKSPPLEAAYSALLKLSSTHEKSIQKDLARTFPQHAYFRGTAGGQESLFNVVKAYSLYDPDVGYTQGLAFIVAALLLNMPEEEAFCVLVRLMHSYDLRSHFMPEMPGLQLRMYQFDRLLEDILPAVHLHLLRAGVKSSMYASQWFMTMFSYRFPLCLVYRIFDIVFAEGIEAIFRFSMALMRKNEEKILTMGFEGVLKFLTDGIFECYKIPHDTGAGQPVDGSSGGQEAPKKENASLDADEDSLWMTNQFVCDAYAVQMQVRRCHHEILNMLILTLRSSTPFMLDSFAGEWEGQLRVQNAHALELDTLRNANRHLSNQVKQLESAVAAMNTEHVEMVKELIESRIERETMEAELVRYKVMYAEISHEQQNALSTQSRMSSVTSLSSR